MTCVLVWRTQHAAQRHKFYGALKSRADKKEGWLKLQREMVCECVRGLNVGVHMRNVCVVLMLVCI
jgi:hypothetical protein